MASTAKLAAMAMSAGPVVRKPIGGAAWRIPLRLTASAIAGIGLSMTAFWYRYRDARLSVPSYVHVPDPFIHDPFAEPSEWPQDDPSAIISAVLSKGKSITRLNFMGCNCPNDELISFVARYCPNLEELHLAHTMGRITDDGVALLALGCRKLKVVDFQNLGGSVTDSSLVLLGQKARRLEAFRVCHAGYDGVGDAAIIAIVKNNPELRHINVRGELTGLTDDSLLAIARHAPRLVTLDLSCRESKYSNFGLREILKECKELKLLDIASTGLVSDDLLYGIAAGEGSQLKVLKVRTTECDGQITPQAVEDLRLIRPELVVYTDEDVGPVSV